MDDKPFFEFDLRDYDKKAFGELKKFAKAKFIFPSAFRTEKSCFF